jgi:hypothetical protein
MSAVGDYFTPWMDKAFMVGVGAIVLFLARDHTARSDADQEPIPLPGRRRDHDRPICGSHGVDASRHRADGSDDKERPFGNLLGTLYVALLWAVWHVPDHFAEEGWGVEALISAPVIFAIEFVSLFFARALCVWFYNVTLSSVMMVAIFHASFDGAINALPPRGRGELAA